MKISKLLLATLAVFIFAFGLGMLVDGVLFSWVYGLEPTSVWKPLNFPLIVVLDVFTSFFFVLVYAFLNKGIEAKNKYIKGLIFGILIFVAGHLPGIAFTYVFINVANTVIIEWIILGLVMFPIKGLITSAIYDE